MSRPRSRLRWTVEAGLPLAALVFSTPLAAADRTIPAAVHGPRPAADATLRLYLEVTLNQQRLPGLHVFELRDGRLHAGAATLRALGFATATEGGNAAAPLDALPGVAVRYDASRQRVAIDAPLPLLALETARLGARQREATPPGARTSPGLLLNYDFYATGGSLGESLTASTELRAFGLGRGVFSSTSVARAFRTPGGRWHGDAVRLDSSWTLSFPERAVTATFGDAFTGFLDWSRPVRIGGIQVGRNYALQPYRITAPMPEFLGEAVVPSDIELFVNGVRQYSGRAPVGPFQLTTVPGVTGAGHAHMVITDAFGQVRTMDFPFYSTQRLLARGLTDWSLSLGAVREDYGLRSFSYSGRPVASGSWRRGMSDRFTLEAHAEAADGLVNLGIGGAWLLGMAGVLHASHAHGEHAGAGGWQRSLGYAWNNRRFNLSFDARRTGGDYRDIAALHGAPPPRRSERATAGVNTGALGNFSLSYARLEHAMAETAPSRYAGLYWNRRFGRWSASLSANRNLDDGSDRSAYLALSLPLGERRHASGSWQRNGGRDQLQATLSQPLPGDGGLGWRVQGRSGDAGSGGLAEVDWQGATVRLGAGASRFDGDHHAFARASGSLVRMGGATFAARRIHDAFAVVSTGGHAGIPVRLENRVIGETDARGLLLVPRLRAWEHNRLSIDPLDLPAHVRVGAVEQMATPPDRAGTQVRFEVRPVRAAVVVLHDGKGRPLPLGTRVTAQGASGHVLVGYGGEAYLEGFEPGQVALDADLQGRTCTVDFAYPDDPQGVPRIGPLRCREGVPR